MMYESQVVGNYVIVSPVKDEEKYIETTIKSVIGQTVRPSSWIIVDDGSRDRTSGIVRKYCQRYSWIHFVRIDRGAEKQVGSAEVSAFVLGYKQVEADHEFVVKLDGDLDLPEDYFAGLIARFREDETLGIASGLFLEQKGKRWVLCRLPDYHAVGASKMVRIECYRQIGGFILEPGWDTVDEIRARAIGWNTCHFRDLMFHHLKPEGSASGYLRRSSMCGEIDYRSGISLSFFLLKAFHRMIVGRPTVLAGAALFFGFFRALLLRKSKLVTCAEENLYRQLLNRRVASGIRNLREMLGRRAWVSI